MHSFAFESFSVALIVNIDRSGICVVVVDAGNYFLQQIKPFPTTFRTEHNFTGMMVNFLSDDEKKDIVNFMFLCVCV